MSAPTLSTAPPSALAPATTPPRAGALAAIVVAQFCATAVWFSQSAGARTLAAATGWSSSAIGALGSATQVGFAAGALALALTRTLDRRSLTALFVGGAIGSGLANLALFAVVPSLPLAIVVRVIVGIGMAFVYPVGIRLALQLAGAHAPHAIALLVAMVCLGTGAPNLALSFGRAPDWQAATLVASALSVVGAMLVIWARVPTLAAPAETRTPPKATANGAHSPHDARALRSAPAFWRAVAAYCGHMWELYPFWALVPWLAGSPPLAFGVFVAGALCCAAGGIASRRVGPFSVARIALVASLVCALLFPLIADVPAARAIILLLWGAAVIPDSPHLSVLAARAAPAAVIGTAIALSTSIGFIVSAVGIQVASALVPTLGVRVAWLLAIGPMIGLAMLRPTPTSTQAR